MNQSLEQHIQIIEGEELERAITGYRTDQHTLLIDNPNELYEGYSCRLYQHGWIPGCLDPEYNLVGCFDLDDLEPIVPLLIIGRDKINELSKTKKGDAS